MSELDYDGIMCDIIKRIEAKNDVIAAENMRLRKEAAQLYAALKLYRPGIWDTVDAMTREKMVDAALAVHDARIQQAIDSAA